MKTMFRWIRSVVLALAFAAISATPAVAEVGGGGDEFSPLVPPLPGQIVRALPGQLVRPLPGQLVPVLPGQFVAPLPGQVVSALAGQVVRPLPRQVGRRVLAQPRNLAQPGPLAARLAVLTH